jgi:hypothetical protein
MNAVHEFHLPHVEFGLADLTTDNGKEGPGPPARAFELLSAQALPSGVTLHTYKFAGPLRSA